MIKLIVIFASLNVLNIYCQLNCGSFNDDTCGGLTSFKSKCHQFVSGCEEIQVDDGCKFDETHKCVEEKSLGTNEKCYSYSSNDCVRIKHQCTSYIDEECGGYVESNDLKQCIKFPNKIFCVEIDIDDSCQVKKVDGRYECVKKDDVVEENFDIKYECELENNSCKKRKKACSELTTNCNLISASTGKTCSHVLTETYCKEVEINDNCKIDATNGFKCINNPDSLPAINQKCFFTDENTKCKPISCQEIVATDKATCNSLTLSTGTCSKVIDVANCRAVTINNECTIDTDGNCKDGTLTDADKICDFNTGKTTCAPRAKTCEEYLASADCSSKGESSGKTCSKVISQTFCKEMTIDNQCEIDTNGNCELKANTPSGSCSLDLVNRRCKFTSCTEYNSESEFECNSAKGCVFLGSCKEFTVGQNCQVSDGICSDTDSPEDTEKTKCLFDNEKPECIKREKKCEDYTSNACKDLTYPNSKKKCFYYDSSCHEVELDKYCTVNDSGNCIEKGDSDLSDTEICGFISEKECKRRKRKCEELLSEDICNNYTPINNQFCFKYEDDDTPCDVITVEDGCQINSSNKCVAKRKQDSCTLDKDNKRCYKSKSGASLLSLKIFSLLFLFFIC